MNSETKRIIIVMYVISALFLTGCGSSVSVKKLSDKDTGIPYYLPRPYLLITRGLSTTAYKPKVKETITENLNGTRTTTKITEQISVTSGVDKAACSMEIIYLPDLRDKYGIRINPGLGKSETKITLENGWKLTSLAENTDTRVPETITATAALVSSIAALSVDLTDVTKAPGAAPKEPAKYSISIYEMVWDGEAIKFDVENPVFEWPPRINTK